MANAYRDQNNVPTLTAVSNIDGQTPVRLYADPVTHRLLVDNSGSGGGVLVKDATGAVDGSNQTFTTDVTPLFVAIDDAIKFNGFGISITGVAPAVTITKTDGIAPALYVKVIYNS